MYLKFKPFSSPYLPNFTVLEEQEGNTRRYPRTDQLPLLLRALNLGFNTHLPPHVARADKRANDFVKMERYTAAILFCGFVNEARPDGLRLHALLDDDRVARVSIVQQSVEKHNEGDLHRFKFYAGEDFFREVRVNGRRIVVAKHVLDRFTKRTQNPVGVDLTVFLDIIFGSPAILMSCGKSVALTYLHDNSILAFIVRPSDSAPEYFLATCLTCKEVPCPDGVGIPQAFIPHFGTEYKEPIIRNWNPTFLQQILFTLWKSKAPFINQAPTPKELKWATEAQKIKDYLKKEGHGVGSKLLFRDNIPGPGSIMLKPGQAEPHHVLLEDFKMQYPTHDWEEIDREQRAANPCWY